jgi:ATP-dependent RNA helicase DeaD
MAQVKHCLPSTLSKALSSPILPNFSRASVIPDNICLKRNILTIEKEVRMEQLLFKDMDLSKEVQKALVEMGFEEPTPIQAQSIPAIMAGKDIIGQAQTGTGKTCAFGIPAIEGIDPDVQGIQVLVLSPTRELAIQISEELKHVSKHKRGVGILPVYGGQPIDRQINALRKRPQIIIGTPGRIMDHMRRNTLKLNDLKLIVLDEADEMLNMGFREDIDIILEKVPQDRQTVLFSATMPKEILDLTKKYQKSAVHVKSIHKELTVPSIEQFYLEVREGNKLDVLSRVIDANNIKLSLVFCNTKKRVDELTSNLQSRGYMAEALHGDMKQIQRDRVMSKFRSGAIDILIATDVAARGIDVDDVEAVFNYDLPNDEEYYVHRIGRTGRAGRTGKAYTFASGRDIYKVRDIQRYTKSNIRLIKPPTLEDVEENKIGSILETVKSVLTDGHLSRYIRNIEKMLEDPTLMEEQEGDVTTLDIAAAFLKMAIEQNGRQAEKENVREVYADNGAEAGMVRLFLNAGSMDKIQPQHIVKGFASNTSLPGSLIGAINIYDKYSFVEIPGEYAGEVVSKMKNQKLNGRKINIEVANKRQ